MYRAFISPLQRGEMRAIRTAASKRGRLDGWAAGDLRDRRRFR
jgi:hypothetical protein